MDNWERIQSLKQEVEALHFAIEQMQSRLLPMDGTTGQVLAKVDATSYNVQWSTAGSGTGKTMRQILKQQILTDR